MGIVKRIVLLLAICIASQIVANSSEYVGRFDLIASQINSSENKRSDTIEYYFAQTKTAIVIHGRKTDEKLRLIFDFNDSTITGLYELNGNKGGYILPIDEKHWPGLPDSKFIPKKLNEEKNIDYTGVESKIEGMSCKEILTENSEYSARMMITNDINLSMFQILSYQSVGKGKSRKELDLFKGFGVTALPIILELKGKDKKMDIKLSLSNFENEFDESIFSSEGYNPSKID